MNILLTEILAAREARAQRQQQLLRQYRRPLVCFTLNIPGPVKDSPLIRRTFRTGLSLLEERIENVAFRDAIYAITGCEGYFIAEMPAGQLKDICTQIEETHPLGRLFDMDVLDLDGRKLERPAQRSCMVCGKPGRGCAASRAHSADVLQRITRSIMTDYFSEADSGYIGNQAVAALLEEVHTTPKPGLVDENNCGSHDDMDIPLFVASAHALRPYFVHCAALGQQTAASAPEETFSLLRAAGIEAEKQMFAATGGINTHKGAVYTLGILCGAAGRLWKADTPFATAETILQEAARMTKESVRADLAAIAVPQTAGEQLYIKYGLTGIRGEAAAGFPSIANIGLPAYRQQLARGKSKNVAAAIALLHLIAKVEDTNLYHRGGKDGADFAKAAAAAVLPDPTTEAITQLDREFVERKLSPGGCADLLAATIFLDSLG